MRELHCDHCDNTIGDEDTSCESCGMPLSPSKRISPQRRFIYWFILIVIFSFVMMAIVPFFGTSRY